MIVNDEYAKVESKLDGTDEAEEAAIKQAVSSSNGSFFGKILRKGTNAGSNLLHGAADAGTKALAGGLAAVQSISATSVLAVAGTFLGLSTASAGDGYPLSYRDDVTAENQYACLDEYVDAYAGVFGSLEEQPLPDQDNNVLLRLSEINEWSKEYVGQSIEDKLVCRDPDCPFYGHEGCTDPNHLVEQVEDGTYTYAPSGAKIDLANVKRIHSFLSEYGLTDVQIAAICGVMTVESHIDFTSVENYNIQGERYNLDPSTTTSEFGFKPWAEGIGSSPITTATCIHQIAANDQPGPEDAIDYAAYSSKYPNVYKLGIGLFGFTDGPGFYNNTFLRNYADYINDRVTLIQRLIEGSKGWREELRQRAADLYHIAYGAEKKDIRGTAQNYIEKVDGSTMLILGAPKKSTGWNYKAAWNEYDEADKDLRKAVEDYTAAVEAYEEAAKAVRENTWSYHGYTETEDGTTYEITFEKDDVVKDQIKYTTDLGSGKFMSICTPEMLYECGATPYVAYYVEYSNRNAQDIVYPQMKPVYEEEEKGALSDFTFVCNCPSDPGPAPSTTSSEYSTWCARKAAYDAGQAEHPDAEAAVNKANECKEAVEAAYEDLQEKLEIFKEKLKAFNALSKAHAISVVNFYNALQDYYTAASFDMEEMIRDAAYKDTTIYNDTELYTQAAFTYSFNASLDGENVIFKDLFRLLYNDGEKDDPDSDKELDPTVQELKLYYELWQNYAKYATNLPKSGKYINWWTPEVQLLFMVGGSYDADLGRGIKIRDEYKFEGNPDGCPICLSGITMKYDTVGEYYYNWMSTWKGDDYTGRDLTTATKNFFYDIVSGGFDDGTLQLRTEYAYAYYYMFQYGTPYQQAINYAAVGGEAADIMDEMISEGRWQVNTSNTLSDTAMPHNDKWKEYQDADTTRQWEIDTSTNMSQSLLATLGEEQSHSKVNLLENIQNGCQYINVINNSTLGNAAIYLTDNPLIYADKSDKFYIMKYGDSDDNSATEPVSSLYKVVFNTINKRLAENGKATMSGSMTDGFTFVKTCVLWSGMDMEFENITNASQLATYLEEATSSIWQGSDDYQTSFSIGRANTRIWEQRKLGPYYTSSGTVYYKYRWYLVPRVLYGGSSSNTGLDWYDDMRSDSSAESISGDIEEDLDYWYIHGVDEHDTNNLPTVRKGFATNGYVRPTNIDNNRTADWVRVDWECYDEDCDICHGEGGHGDTDMLLPGDIFINGNQVGMWLGEDTVQSMYPLEENNSPKLVYVGGSDAQKIKSMEDGVGFDWSKPCSAYINHDTPCPEHDNESNYPTSPTKSDSSSCNPYNPDGKWTVYRLVTPNYTDSYRSAGVTFNPNDEDDWEMWYKYRYKGMAPSADTKTYLEEVRKDLRKVINTNYDRDTR